ncbi:hypothetical protein [Clostridium estertheticum]|uniref:hypothetical protein n=1 Tax=Clostridium estertheticum TaxID=238834 RepID=UPI001C0E3003|nr:hypothetical protein [Clostridium estertheticum]MBU3169895.1 hypothetical protein [Clostridium estertheticum]
MDKIVYFTYYLIAGLILIIAAIYVCLCLKEVDLLNYNIKFYIYSLLEQINKILVKILYFLFAIIIINCIYKIAILIGVTQYINITDNWITSNKEAFNTILGAFLASSLGILVQIMINKNTKKNQQSKYSKLLYNDISYCLEKLDIYEFAASISSKPSTRLFDKSFKKINFDDNWRNNYSYLTGMLPITYYNKVTEIYSIIERFNLCIENRDINQIRNVLTDLRFVNINKLAGDVNNISNEELLEAFSRLSKNKKVKSKIFSNLVQEIYVKRLKKKYSIMIENALYNLVLNSKDCNVGIINGKLKKILKNQNKSFNKINDRIIGRIIFEVSFSSKKIDLPWDEYKIVEKRHSYSGMNI